MQALIDAQNTPALPNASIVLVISNRKAAYGLTRAAEAHIPTKYLALQTYLKAHPDATREDYDAEIAQMVLEAKPDIVVRAGWMHILSDRFLELMVRSSSSEGQHNSIPVINLHPALPNAFDGAHAIERGYEAFQKGEVDELGVMVHRVIRDVDKGEPVIVSTVPLEKNETLEVFEARLHEKEHEIIVQATAKVLQEAETQ